MKKLRQLFPATHSTGLALKRERGLECLEQVKADGKSPAKEEILSDRRNKLRRKFLQRWKGVTSRGLTDGQTLDQMWGIFFFQRRKQREGVQKKTTQRFGGDLGDIFFYDLCSL